MVCRLWQIGNMRDVGLLAALTWLARRICEWLLDFSDEASPSLATVGAELSAAGHGTSWPELPSGVRAAAQYADYSVICRLKRGLSWRIGCG